MSLVEGTKYPLEDGQVIDDPTKGRKQKVMGSIVTERGSFGKPDTYDHTVCWTLQGNWYRRSDGVEMTGAGGPPMTIKEFYALRKAGKMGGVG